MINHPTKKLKAVYLLFAFMLFGTIHSMAYNKHALLVGISDYGNTENKPGKFKNINGAADLQILSPELRKQGFKITVLKDSKATHKAIISALNKLITRCNAGDIVYLHFSTHGQLVEDLDGDEPDGWDEAIIPYDAQLTYKKGVYEGQNHLLDDELSIYINKIRKKLGADGCLYVVVDACHSGTSSRNVTFEDMMGIPMDPEEDEGPVRGTPITFSKNGKKFNSDKYRPNNNNDYFRLRQEKGKAPVVFLEACRSNEQNTEVRDKHSGKFYGPLTYHIVQTLRHQNISKDMKWVNYVKDSFENDRSIQKRSFPQKQHMVIESTN